MTRNALPHRAEHVARQLVENVVEAATELLGKRPRHIRVSTAQVPEGADVQHEHLGVGQCLNGSSGRTPHHDGYPEHVALARVADGYLASLGRGHEHPEKTRQDQTHPSLTVLGVENRAGGDLQGNPILQHLLNGFLGQPEEEAFL